MNQVSAAVALAKWEVEAGRAELGDELAQDEVSLRSDALERHWSFACFWGQTTLATGSAPRRC